MGRVPHGLGGIYPVVIIDFEASCLPEHGRSYPIEVAVGDIDTGVVQEWLIRPEPQWMKWDWDPAAERAHGLSQDTIVRGGESRAKVARAVARILNGQAVLSDHPPYDQLWLARLMQGDPGVRIEPLQAFWDRIVGGARRALIERALAHARQVAPIRHRAGADVRHHLAVLDFLFASCGKAL
jgi:hypothetical protein